MCFGLAAVTTNTGFGGDYLTDGVNAAVIPPSSEHLARAVHTLLQDPARHARLAAAGREAARSFTLARMAAAYERAFTELRPSAAEEIEAPAYA
jgi:glycosyltransferase involved in cell wall biosynthesis